MNSNLRDVSACCILRYFNVLVFYCETPTRIIHYIQMALTLAYKQLPDYWNTLELCDINVSK